MNKWYKDPENFTNIHKRYFKVYELNFTDICVEYKKIQRKMGQHFASVKQILYIPIL